MAGRSEAAAQFIEKAEVNVDPFVFGTIERAGSGRRAAATGLNTVAEEDQLGVTIGSVRLLRENLRPSFLRVIEYE